MKRAFLVALFVFPGVVLGQTLQYLNLKNTPFICYKNEFVSITMPDFSDVFIDSIRQEINTKLVKTATISGVVLDESPQCIGPTMFITILFTKSVTVANARGYSTDVSLMEFTLPRVAGSTFWNSNIVGITTKMGAELKATLVQNMSEHFDDFALDWVKANRP
jgi:hypothetical protein